MSVRIVHTINRQAFSFTKTERGGHRYFIDGKPTRRSLWEQAIAKARAAEAAAYDFQKLDEAAAWMNRSENPALYDGVNYVIAHAADNASDNAGRIDSIASMLSFPDEIKTPEVQAWFVARGVRF